MTHITLEEKERLEKIRRAFSRTAVNGVTRGDDWVLHNLCLYGTDEEVVPYLNAPDEWIREAYPYLSSLGAYFREVEKMVIILRSLNKWDSRVTEFSEAWESNENMAYPASREANAWLDLNLLDFEEVLTPNEWDNFYNQFGSAFFEGIKNTILGLVTRDLIIKENYEALTLPWRKVFGPLTTQDKENFHTEFDLVVEGISS